MNTSFLLQKNALYSAGNDARSVQEKQLSGSDLAPNMNSLTRPKSSAIIIALGRHVLRRGGKTKKKKKKEHRPAENNKPSISTSLWVQAKRESFELYVFPSRRAPKCFCFDNTRRANE
jgi:hypothetical protein